MAESDPGHPALGRAADWLRGQTGDLPVEVAASVHTALAAAGRATPTDRVTLTRWESADTTGSILEAIGPSHAATRRGIDWLVEHQEFDGSWRGRWGVAWLYGTCFALRGLAAAGESDREAHVLRAGEWVRSIQNSDGGWGESCAGFDMGAFTVGPSTPSQTAWAILGLIAGGDPDSLSVRHGVDYLVRTQLSDGSWAEDQPTGVALPGAVYVRRELDKDIFPLMALAAFAKARPNV
jgi:squalene-hopene/tetraprenyl-beta-curcumene cyclase